MSRIIKVFKDDYDNLTVISERDLKYSCDGMEVCVEVSGLENILNEVADQLDDLNRRLTALERVNGSKEE